MQGELPTPSPSSDNTIQNKCNIKHAVTKPQDTRNRFVIPTKQIKQRKNHN